MAKFLVASLPFAGHVGPMAAVTAELAGRGHDVVAYTGEKYRARFEAAGATWLPWVRATDFDDADLAATFPDVGNGKGRRAGRANVDQVLFGTAVGQVEDLRTAGPWDLLVTDQLAFGGALTGLTSGRPWATVAVTPLTLRSRTLPPYGLRLTPGPKWRDAALRALLQPVYRLLDPQLNRVRAAAGLGKAPPGSLFDTLHSPHLVLAQGVPGLDYPRGDLPSHVHHVGRLAPPGSPGVLPSWWPDLSAGRPVVHVTQGTLDTDPDDLLRPALAALADQDVLVVCTTGSAPVSALGELPANARAAPFLPHGELLPLVDVVVTNGGWGGVLASVQAGIPLVVAGATLDKPEVARRVAWSGAGLDLRTGSPRPARIAAAVRTVLDRPEYRRRAGELGARLTAAGGVRTAADLLLSIAHAAR